MNSINEMRLIQYAMRARDFAYAPYSGFKVGAAVLTDKKVYYGANIENASYGACNCAERTAIFKAVSEGERNFEAIAIIGGKDDGDTVKDYAYPCGICRQVMTEFCKPDFLIYVVKSYNEYKVYKLSELMPEGFCELN